MLPYPFSIWRLDFFVSLNCHGSAESKHPTLDFQVLVHSTFDVSATGKKEVPFNQNVPLRS